MITQLQEQTVRNSCYQIGTSSIGPWLRRIVELENELTALKAIFFQREREPRETFVNQEIAATPEPR